MKGGAYLQAKKKHRAQFALADPFKYFDEANFKNPDGKNWNAPAGDFMAQEIPDWMPTTASKLVDYRAAPLFASGHFASVELSKLYFKFQIFLFNKLKKLIFSSLDSILSKTKGSCSPKD